jgi:ABC-type transport system substrate-binding protein
MELQGAAKGPLMPRDQRVQRPERTGPPPKENNMNPIRKVAFGAAVLGTTLTGGAIGATFLSGTATAQTSSSTASTATPASPAQQDPSMGGHTANGITEALLTGQTASQVTAAAQSAVVDGTIERVENDAEGAAYEAHMVKADGTHVTVKVNADFSVAGIETSR